MGWSCQLSVDNGVPSDAPVQLDGPCDLDGLLDDWRVSRIEAATNFVPLDMDFAGTELGVCLDQRGRLWRTDNQGLSWSPSEFEELTATPEPGQLRHVTFSQAGTLWVVTNDNRQPRLWHSDDGGDSFEERSMPGAEELYDIAFVDEQRGLALARLRLVPDPVLFETTDGGRLWTTVSLPEVAAVGDRLFAGPANSLLLNTRDTAGRTLLLQHLPDATWRAPGQPLMNAPYKDLISFLAMSDQTWLASYQARDPGVFSGLFNARVYRTTDAGATWQEVLKHDHNSPAVGQLPGGGPGFLFTAYRATKTEGEREIRVDAFEVDATTNDGRNWSKRIVPESCALTGPFAAPSPEVLVIARRGSFLRIDLR